MNSTWTELDNSHRVYRGFTIRRQDPYGFWNITEGDQPVKGLEENYTMASLAAKAIDNFLYRVEQFKAKEKKKKAS